MKIAVTTPTGHVGSAVTDFLLLRGGDVKVKLMGRRRNTLVEFIDRGAETAIGAQVDVDYCVAATRDADALFWVTPPGYGSDSVRAFQNRLGRAGAAALRTNLIPRVVNLSSVGAQLDSGAGPISGLHDVEGLLDEAAANITHLRPGFFFENLLWQLDGIRESGRISLPISGSRRYPMIATRDIGRVAADRLASRDWTGRSVRELHGPADLSFNEVAEILSEALGRKIVYVQCDPLEARKVMIESSLSENAADLMLEMYRAVDEGRLKPVQPRTAESTTPTTLMDFATEVLRPLVTQSVPK